MKKTNTFRIQSKTTTLVAVILAAALLKRQLDVQRQKLAVTTLVSATMVVNIKNVVEEMRKLIVILIL